MARGNAAALGLGPGFLYFAPLGTPEPTDLTTPWATVSASWVAIGYTEDGSELSYNPSTSPVDAAVMNCSVNSAVIAESAGSNRLRRA